MDYQIKLPRKSFRIYSEFIAKNVFHELSFLNGTNCYIVEEKTLKMIIALTKSFGKDNN